MVILHLYFHTQMSQILFTCLLVDGRCCFQFRTIAQGGREHLRLFVYAYILDFLLGECRGGEGLASMLLTKDLRNCQTAFWHLTPVFSFSVSFSVINSTGLMEANKRSSQGPSPFTLLPNRDSMGEILWLSLFCLSPGRSPPQTALLFLPAWVFLPFLYYHVCEGLDYLFFLSF